MSDDLPIVIFGVAFVAFLAGLHGERWRAARARTSWLKRRPSRKGVASSGSYAKRTASPALDSADQLRLVMGAEFAKRRLLSKAEAQVFYAAERAVKEQRLTWRVMAQVNLEVLTSSDSRAFLAINSKRVDILIISSSGDPILAIEYQGGGHYQGTASARDAVKKEALRKAGVRYFEMTPEHGAQDVAREIARIASIELQGQRPQN